MPLRSFLPLLAITAPLAHGNAPSALVPQGDQAVRIADIAWVLFVGGGLIFVAVMALAAVALFGTAAQRAALGRQTLIIGAGVVFPVVVLSALLVYTFSAVGDADVSRPAARIEVTGELWWWRVRYLDDDGRTLVETANEIRIPAQQPVELLLTTTNVIHSFWVPNLAGKIDMLPGHVNRLRLRAHAPGVFHGQCAEYCGAQHAKMALQVVAETPDDYAAWLAAMRLPAQEPRDPLLRQGRQLFLAHRCGQCHTVRGTPAVGTLGPDLTHVGGRQSLGAGLLPNGAGALAGWIVGVQQLKPGSKMPSFNQFSGEELRALAAYLDSLRPLPQSAAQ